MYPVYFYNDHAFVGILISPFVDTLLTILMIQELDLKIAVLDRVSLDS